MFGFVLNGMLPRKPLTAFFLECVTVAAVGGDTQRSTIVAWGNSKVVRKCSRTLTPSKLSLPFRRQRQHKGLDIGEVLGLSLYAGEAYNRGRHDLVH